MQIPEEFGNYLLLKKLTEDFLGETFRAGKLGTDGVDQVVLLRVFNGKGMDGERLWGKVSGRAAIQQALRSPNIGNGVDLGRVRSFPYTAYDYISGKNLATLMAQALRQGSPIPTDHALLIAERISLALAVAYENRVADERILHGFVVPHLVMVSNEGETRLLGFDVAPGLRELAATGWREGDFAPYLAPEALTTGAAHKSDDVWSLGAILYELTTGQRLPPAGPEGYGPIVDQAISEHDGSPLPAVIAGLLKKSLAPREARLSDAVAWHKTVSKLMIDGHFSPTTFNLAFFMHNLFRDEIEREGQEMQAEKKLSIVPRPAATAAVAAAAASVAAPRGGPKAEAAPGDRGGKGTVRETTLPGTRIPGAAPAPPPRSKAPILAGLAAVFLLAVAGAVYYFFLRAPAKPGPPTDTQAADTQPLLPPAPVPAATEPAAPGTSPEQLQAEISAMFDARSKEMEAKLREQYDQKIRDLQKQLEDSRKPGAAPAPAPARPPATELAAIRPSTRPEPSGVQIPPPASTAPAPQNPPAAPPATASPSPAPTDPEPRTEPAAPATAAAPTPQVQVGDLVQPGAGVTGPAVVGSLDQRYPAAAKRMKKSGNVELKVLVDERGRVLEVREAGPKAGFGFDEAAIDAARRATFRPATKNGVRVKMWATLKVSFKP